MTTEQDRVSKKIAQTFSPEDSSPVGHLLDGYESPSSVSVNRVRLAILKLSEGDIDRLPELIELVEHECDGVGTLAYFAAYDGDRAGVWCPSSAVWSRWRLELESS